MSASIELYPAPEADRAEVEAPVREVTLLEDRAQVERRGKVQVKAGLTRLIVRGVAPVLQDVSLVASVAGAVKVADARVRRALRVRRATRPERARALEEEIEAKTSKIHDLGRDRLRVEDRQRRTVEILVRSAIEIPEDAGWGLMNHQAWRDNIESLLARSKKLALESLATKHAQEDLREEAARLILERTAFDRPDFDVTAWIEVDLAAESAGEAELTLAYVVPNALWRPIHSARLRGVDLAFSSRAAVWQNTGEDWKDVTLKLSTARSSLGHEPPLLEDDLLAAQKKNPEVHVQARQVKIHKAGVDGGGAGAPPPDTGVELPGVDDGGETRTLEARGPSTVPSDGRPVLLPLFDFASPASPELVLMAEIEPKVILKATSKNTASAPVLAGPVELVRESGVVGWTKVPFVAPGERFELGFGPDEALRVVRTEVDAEEQDSVDRWMIGVRVVQLYVSNLSSDPKRVAVTERIPVSELREVEVTLLADKTTKGVEADRDGLCRWSLDVPAKGRKRLRLCYAVATAPGVTMG